MQATGPYTSNLVDDKLAAMKKAVRQQLQDESLGAGCPPKMKLSVHFAGVQLEVPLSSHAGTKLVLALGLVRVKNLFHETKQQVCENMLVSVSKLEGHIKVPAEEGQYNSQLLLADEVRVVFCHPVHSKREYDYGPAVALDIDAGTLKISIADSDLPFLLGIAKNNLTETATVCKPRLIDNGPYGSDDEDTMSIASSND